MRERIQRRVGQLAPMIDDAPELARRPRHSASAGAVPRPRRYAGQNSATGECSNGLTGSSKSSARAGCPALMADAAAMTGRSTCVVRMASGKRRASSFDRSDASAAAPHQARARARRLERGVVAAQPDCRRGFASRLGALPDHGMRRRVLRAVVAGQFREVRLGRRRDAPAKLLVRLRDLPAKRRDARLPVGRPGALRFGQRRVPVLASCLPYRCR